MTQPIFLILALLVAVAICFSLEKISVDIITLLLLCALVLQPAVPEGWYMAGSKPSSYESGTDEQEVYGGHASAYLKSKESVTDGFGTLMQNFQADKYAGTRIRLSASVKAEKVEDWAGLWMRVDKGHDVVSFDNMQDRPIKGTADWKLCEVVLDVPKDATGVFFGILLSKTGTVWVSGIKFETVGNDVPVTDVKKPQRDGPSNLNFEKQ